MEKTPPISPLFSRLARADAAWRAERARTLVWRAAPWLLGAAVFALALDAFLQLGVAARLSLVVSGLVGALVVAGVAFFGIRLRRSPPERVARHLESREPALGSRLINALQLSEQARDPSIPPLTRDLAARAAEQSVADFGTVDFPRLARTGSDRHALVRALLVAGLAIVLGLVFYPVSEIVLPRFLDPFGDHPPYAFTRVEIVEPLADNSPVVYGKTLAVRVAWHGHEPRELFLAAHPPDRPDERVTVPMVRDAKRGFIADLADVRSDLVLVAGSKDRSFYSQQRLVRVVLTPRMEQAWVEIAPPAYTALRAEERKLEFKSIGALHGSTLRFRLRSNRPLRAGLVELRREGADDDKPELLKLALREGESHEVHGETAATSDARLRFSVTDIDGLVSEPSPETLLTLSHDLAPQVDVREPARDGFVSIAFALPLKVEATDDYGVRLLRVHRALNGNYTEPLVVAVEDVRRDANVSLVFDFVRLGARPGDRVSFFAEALDSAPEPKLGRSRTVTMTLISEDEYNQHLRETTEVADIAQKYAALAERFTALRDEQARLAEEAKALAERIAKNGGKPAPEDETAAADLAARQDALDQRIDALADELRDFVRPNPVYDFERDLARQLALQSGALQESTRQSREARDAAARDATDPAARAAALERRAREQAERLGASRQNQAEGMDRPLRDLSRLHELVNDFNLFEQAFLAQEALAEQMRAYETKPDPTREDQLAMKDLAARQAAVREVLRQLPERLRENAGACEGEFPKAAAGGRAMADAIEQGRMGAKAENATERLLQARGREGAALTRQLADEMAALMSKCEGGEGGMREEIDEYLRARMPGGRGAGQTWEQMRMSRKFGLQGQADNPLSAMGRGRAGVGAANSGYSMPGNNPPPVLGAEPAAAQAGQTASRAGTGQGAGDGRGEGGAPAVQTGKADVLKGANPTDRESGATPGELGADEYRELVDEYFKQLTRP
jgi:hypothetical protein